MRKLTAAIAVTGLAAALAACSSSSKSHDNHTPPPASSGTTSSQTGGGSRGGIGAAAFVAQATTAADQAQTVKFKSSGVLLGSPMSASGELRLGDKTVDADVTETGALGDVDVIVVANVVYIKGLEKGDPGKPWVKDASLSKEIADLVTKADPRQTLPMLESVGTLKPLGTETVNGVAATHYSVTVDLAKIAKQNPDLAKAAAAAMQAGAKAQTLQIWVDAQKRPVRLITAAEIPNPVDKAKKLTMSQTVDYTDWGAPVTIAAPPADQVSEK